MPVYNGSKYLLESVRSILNQSFFDFEFIIIDDGSTDNSVEIIKSINHKSIILKQNTTNRGNYYCRNIGIEQANGRYICVMDADDISEPSRLQRQFQFMECNEEVGICGTFIRNIPSNIIPRFLTDCEHLKVAFLSNNHCSHPSLLMRRKLLDKYELRYNEEYYYSADYDLCARSLKCFKLINIPEVLLNYRRHSEQISDARKHEQEEFADKIRIRQIEDIFGLEPDEIPISLHLKLMKKKLLGIIERDDAIRWLEILFEKNRTINYYNQKILEQFLLSLLNTS